MFTKVETTAKPHRLPGSIGDVLEVEVHRLARSTKRDADDGDRPIDEQQRADHGREQARAGAAEVADRVAQGRQAEGEGNRHEEQAPEQVLVIHVQAWNDESAREEKRRATGSAPCRRGGRGSRGPPSEGGHRAAAWGRARVIGGGRGFVGAGARPAGLEGPACIHVFVSCAGARAGPRHYICSKLYRGTAAGGRCLPQNTFVPFTCAFAQWY